MGPLLVCRRCAVLYPVAFVCAAAMYATDVPLAAALAACWILPLPMTLEWVGEHFGRVRHAPGRLAALSALAAVGVGAALAVHLREPLQPDVMAAMATHATACGASALVAARRAPAAPGWEAQHDHAEAERSVRLLRIAVGDEPSADADGTIGRGETATAGSSW
jgi:hypothetical protein